MNISLWCLFFVGFLPMICAGISKSKLDYDNQNPRAWMSKQSGFRSRAYSAQQNSWEAFLWFSVAILLAQTTDQAQSSDIEIMAVGYVFSRIFYLTAYVLDFAMLRTIFWGIAFFLNILIFIKAVA